MTDVTEQPSQPGPESAQSASLLAPEAETQTTAELPEGEQSPETQAPEDETAELLKLLPPDDGLEEIEYEGKKAKVPKELKDAFLRQADYTRKTQEVAEQRRAAEAERVQLQQQAQFQQTHIKEIAQLHGVDDRLQQLAQVNWQALNASDPVKAQALHIEYTQLQAVKGQLVNSLTQKNQQMQLESQRLERERANQAEAVVMREIKGWSADKYRELQTFSQSKGIEPETLRQMLINVPHSVKLIEDARMWNELIARRGQKPAAKPAPSPVTRIAAQAAPASVDPEKLPMDEWVRYREKQLAAKRKQR